MDAEIDALRQGIINQDRLLLAKAISLIESTNPSHVVLARNLLKALQPQMIRNSSKSLRVAISGIPGVGKSTLIERLGLCILAKDPKARLGVLSVDPSSPVSGGSILADKTRMQELANLERAFIRPAANRGYWGGVSEFSGEIISLLEAANYNIILLETVGVGQNEYLARDLADILVVVHMPKTGDGFQEIKKGIFELADIFAVNKADGELLPDAKLTKSSLDSSMALAKRKTPVLLLSALEGLGVASLWEQILTLKQEMAKDGRLGKQRENQRKASFDRHIRDALILRLQSSPGYAEAYSQHLANVKAGQESPILAAETVVQTCLPL